MAANGAMPVLVWGCRFHALYKRADGKLDPAVHTYFAAHRRVITWLIARDVSVLFQRLNFILGHDCLHHLFKVRRFLFFCSLREWAVLRLALWLSCLSLSETLRWPLLGIVLGR